MAPDPQALKTTSARVNREPELIANRCTELEGGARVVDALITNSLLPKIGREFLTCLLAGGTISRVRLGRNRDTDSNRFYG